MGLGITALALLMLVSVIGTEPFAGVPNSSSNNVSVLNKYDESITAYDKAIEINPRDSTALKGKERYLNRLNKPDL